MKLTYFDILGRPYYEVFIHNQHIQVEFFNWYFTLTEAKQAIKNFFKSCDNKEDFDVYLNHYNKYGKQLSSLNVKIF